VVFVRFIDYVADGSPSEVFADGVLVGIPTPPRSAELAPLCAVDEVMDDTEMPDRVDSEGESCFY